MATPFPQHLTRIADLDRDQIFDLFRRGAVLADDDSARMRHLGRIIATLFYEPSTRTRLSFESAAHRLGAQVIGFADPRATSVSKGESLIDTIRAVQRYADLIVLRHPAEGAAALASTVARVPIINAGDGGHEHPTQTLFDLYTIWQRLGSLEGRAIGFVGDLRFGRTVHSLAQAAAMFGMTLIGIAPEDLQMPGSLLERLRSRTTVELSDDLDAVLPRLDVLYITRLQRERMNDDLRQRHKEPVVIDHEAIRSGRDDLIVMHPLPRRGEIDYALDEDARAWYFEQLANGVVMRMALLDLMLGVAPHHPIGAGAEPWRPSDPPWRMINADDPRCGNAQCVTNLEPGIAPRWEGDRCTYCDHVSG